MIPKYPKHGRMKPKRLQSKKHLEFVASKPCCICGALGVACHHLIGNYGPEGPIRGWGLRAGDNFVIPLCQKCHGELHANGNERGYLALFGVDGITVASKLWGESHV